MIVESIQLQNFLSHGNSKLVLTDSRLWLISGDNGAGKSSFFDALEYALYGSHRGGETDAKLLVKHGQRTGSVEVVVTLTDGRYSVHCDLDHKVGNKGVRLMRWQSGDEGWVSVNPGKGVEAVWKWLLAGARIPDRRLFHSAILLRQGRTTQFMEGSAKQRTDQFAALIDLSLYSHCAAKAKARKEAADLRRVEQEAGLRALGDISDDALMAAEAHVVSTQTSLDQASQALLAADAVARGATAWAALLHRQADLQSKRARLLALRADAPRIRDAAQRVSAWDQASSQLTRYWSARQRMATEAERGRTLEASAAEEDKKREEQQRKHGKSSRDLRTLEEQDLPHARECHRRATEAIRGLNLEQQIAASREKQREAAEEVGELTGASEELAAWDKRAASLPALDALAQARSERENEHLAAQLANQRAQEAERLAGTAGKERDQARVAEASAAGQAKEAEDRLQELKLEQARLKAQLGHRDSLTGAQAECPVCAQPLNDEIRARVQERLADDRAQLASVESQLSAAMTLLATAKAKLADAASANKLRSEAADKSARQWDKAVTGLEEANKRLAESEVRLAKSRASVAADPEYADRLEVIDIPWVAAERISVERSVAAARVRADALAAAQSRIHVADAKLEALRGQRLPTAAPVGDHLLAAELDGPLGEAQRECETAASRLNALEREAKTTREGVEALAGSVAQLVERVSRLRDSAGSARQAVAQLQDEASSIAAELGHGWDLVLKSEEAYEETWRQVNDLRPSAAQIEALAEAVGQLLVAESDLKEVEAGLERIDPEHRIDVVQAQSRVETARAAESAANSDMIDAKRGRDALVSKRQEAAQREAAIGEARDEAYVFGELSELLKEAGPIQGEVVQREQKAIVDEVNAVLEGTDDSLRVVLGKTRRQSKKVDLLDVLIIDTADAIGSERHFAYLSGGEQFRVALALALALHRRVGKGQAGTIIVDEGFGALDANRRDQLAIHMTDTSKGILSLGLAEQVVISSHSAEVRRHFPYRWIVQKQGSDTTLCRGEGEPDDNRIQG